MYGCSHCQKTALVDVNRAEIFKIPAKQLLLLLIAGAIGGIFDSVLAYSIVVGGLIAIIPQCYLMICAFRYQGARAGKEITKGFYRGESGKFVFTLVGFATTFLFLPWLNTVMVFGGYIAMLIVQIWLTSRAIKQ